MGYASTVPYSILNLKTGLGMRWDNFTTVGSNHTIGDIVVPPINDQPAYAYLDVHIVTREDTSGVINELNGGSFGFIDAGATYRVSNTISPNTGWMQANGFYASDFVLPGVNNLAAYVTAGNLSCRMNSITCAHDSYYVYGVYAELRLYFLN
jgi:hypothetical protein